MIAIHLWKSFKSKHDIYLYIARNNTSAVYHMKKLGNCEAINLALFIFIYYLFNIFNDSLKLKFSYFLD